MKRRVFLFIGVAILLVFVLASIAPQIFTGYGRKESFGAWLEPNGEHILGTNSLGYDVFTELVYGTRDTLVVGLCAGLLSLVIGVLIGFLCETKGIVGGFFGTLVNVFAVFPKLIVVIVLSTFIGGSDVALICLIAAFGWVGTARAVRAKVASLKTKPFVGICSVYGYGKVRTAVKHVLPNLKDVIVYRLLIGVNSAIMTESTLSFLGFGDLYNPTWGVMINFARTRGAIVNGAYAYLLAPCVAITLLSLSIFFISTYFDEKKNTIQDKE